MMTRLRRFLALLLAAGTGLQVPAAAQVPDDRTERIQEYTDRAIDFAPQGSASYTLKRGGKPITDFDLASASRDPALLARVETQSLKGRLYRIEIGAMALPLGLMVGVDNFYGRREAARKVGNLDLPPSSFAPFEADDWRSFVLSAGGAVLALYGAWQLGELFGEAVGAYQPRYLAVEEAKEASAIHNRTLIAELGIQASDVATVTLPASPSPAPSVFTADLPAGTDGSGIWALRRATTAVAAALGSDWRPYLAYTRDILDFEPGVVAQGEWHVVMASTPSVSIRDLDVSVPRHGGAPTWKDAGPEWTSYRSGTDLLDRLRVDSPQALESLKPAFVERQIGWFRPGAMVVLHPFYFRLKDPVWIVNLADVRVAPWVGVNARSATLVDLARYR